MNTQNTISSLIKEGFEGTDASLAESLYEYGLIWKAEGNKYTFIYKVTFDTYDTDQMEFEQAILFIDDFETDYDWVNFKDVAATCGLTVEEWQAKPVPYKTLDLMYYYGIDDIFGQSYGGFTIADK